MKSREFKYLRRKTIRRHQRSPVRMVVSASGIEVKGGIKCDGCGMHYPEADMLRCTTLDDEVEWLCDNCNDGTWYCQCCGRFSAGYGAFEDSGICDNCRDQIEADDWHDDEEYYYDPNW